MTWTVFPSYNNETRRTDRRRSCLVTILSGAPTDILSLARSFVRISVVVRAQSGGPAIEDIRDTVVAPRAKLRRCAGAETAPPCSCTLRSQDYCGAAAACRTRHFARRTGAGVSAFILRSRWQNKQIQVSKKSALLPIPAAWEVNKACAKSLRNNSVSDNCDVHREAHSEHRILFWRILSSRRAPWAVQGREINITCAFSERPFDVCVQ